jgi:hypothetical protein
MRFDALLTCSGCGRKFREGKSGYRCLQCLAYDERRKQRAVQKKIARSETPQIKSRGRPKIRSWRSGG